MSPHMTTRTEFPQRQLLARAGLTLLMGLILMSRPSVSWVGLTCAVAFVLFADGLLALLLRPGRDVPEHPAFTWLRPIWKVNLVLTAATLLALVFRPSLLAVTVTVVMAAMTGSFWLAAYVLSSGSVRRAILGWMGGVLRITPALTSAPDVGMNLRWLGAVAVVMGLLIGWWSRPGSQEDRSRDA